MIEPDKPEETRNLTVPPRLPEPETVDRVATSEEAAGAAVPPAAQRGPDDGAKNSSEGCRDWSAPPAAQQAWSAWRLPPRYQPLGAIARGGMGLVLRVHDVEVDRLLAVKLLLDPDAATDQARRFLEEARITGQLQHPGIPPVHEIGTLSDGRPFFSMKLIAGRTLDELLQARSSPRIDGPRFVQIFEQIAQTVAYAHSQGVIHRDLKPLNVMVGAFGEVQVMDWGLAKRLRDNRPETTPTRTAAIAEAEPASAPPTGATVVYPPAVAEGRTQAGQVMGTFAYMPPEQARGEVQRLDERSDVFGLGAILCRILTGEPPYRSTGKGDLWRQAREGDLSDALVRLEACGAETELIALTKSYLAAEPDERPRHAGVVAEQITAHMQSVQQRLQQAERERAIARAKAIEERKRRRWQLALAASVLLLMLGGSAAGVWYYQDRANRATEAAGRQIETAARQQQLDRDVTTALDEAQRTHDDLYAQLADERAVQALLSDIDSWQTRVQAERSAWQRAERLAAVEPALLAPPVAERCAPAGEQAQTDEADWQLAKKLDDIRLEAAPGDYDVSREAAEPKFASVFLHELQLDMDRGEAASLAERIRQSRLRPLLLTILDQWANVTPDRERATRLLAVTRLADPEPWRNRVRDTRTWSVRTELEQLAREADVTRQPPALLLLLAERLQARGGDARPLLQSTLAVNPRDFWVYFALSEYSTNAYERTGHFQAALAIRPKSEIIHTRYAQSLSRPRYTETVILHYRMALKANPTYARAHLNLGGVLREKGDLDEAIGHYQRAMDLNPIFVTLAHIFIGEALFKKGDREGALRHYRIAQRTATDPHALVNLGNALTEIEELDEAIAVYRKAAQLKVNDDYTARAYGGMGIALAHQKKWDEAIAAYREAIRINPKDAATHSNLGGALVHMEKWEETIAACRKALEIRPNNAATHNILGTALSHQKKLDEAIAAFREAIRINPKDAAYFYANMGFALAGLEKWDEAITAYRKALELRPNDTTTQNNLGNALWGQKKLDEAIAAYRQTIAIDANNAFAYGNLGVMLANKGKLDEAVAAYRQAIRLNPGNARTHHNLGHALQQQKKLDQAISSYRQAIQLDARIPWAYRNLGDALTERGELSEAVTAYRKAIEIRPNDDIAYHNLGKALKRQKKLGEAVAAYRKAIEINPRLASAYNNLGTILREQKKLDEAIAAYRKAIALDADLVVPYDNLAVALRERKKFKEASAAYAKLLAIGPKRFEFSSRYFAACNAVLAGCGKGEDAAELDEAERGRLRRQARDWLQENLRLYRRLFQAGDRQGAQMIAEVLSYWQQDAELETVREPAELAKLPEAERLTWQRLWAEVKELVEQAQTLAKKKEP